MDLNPICHPSPAKKMKCSFLDFVQLLMISQAGRWTQTSSTTPLHLKKWNAHFCITFNFWCWPDWSMDSNPIHHPSAAKKMKCFFFGLRSTSDDWPDWSMDSNPIHQPSPAKKMKSSFLYYVELLMISWAGWWTGTPSATPLQPKKWNAHFWITFDFWWLAGLVDGLERHPPPLSTQKNEMLIFGLRSLLMIDWASWWTWTPSATPLLRKKMKCWFFDYIQHLMISLACQWTQSPSATPLQPIKWNASFWIVFTSDDQPVWLMDSNPICHPSPAIKNEMLIFVLHSTSDVGQTGRWTQTPSTTPLQPKKWNPCFCITLNFWC